jgi:hypothetical protein
MENGKCHLTSDPNCTLCSPMQNELTQQHGPGLWPYVLTNIKTLERRMAGIVITTSRSHKEQPRLLNFCPFCGERLLNDEGKPFHDA